MIGNAFAQQFAAEWEASRSSHDLPRVLSRYADAFEMSSPVIVQITGEPPGRLKGKAAVGAYWQKALEQAPDLRFSLKRVLTGVIASLSTMRVFAVWRPRVPSLQYSASTSSVRWLRPGLTTKLS